MIVRAAIGFTVMDGLLFAAAGRTDWRAPWPLTALFAAYAAIGAVWFLPPRPRPPRRAADATTERARMGSRAGRAVLRAPGRVARHRRTRGWSRALVARAGTGAGSRPRCGDCGVRAHLVVLGDEPFSVGGRPHPARTRSLRRAKRSLPLRAPPDVRRDHRP